ncbi:Natterin-4 [Holothuria leucospilota]|uniref:Natterin-4 n=1 Tax=Holothuria leucospilota TaxID=206669 RepID=A0A9Q0YK54_HOLLE|nr:Natterin-4 [Holothuria leucospilota]
MTSTTWIVVTTLFVLRLALSNAGVYEVFYNEADLTGSCTSNCESLPDRTDKYGCDRITKCRYGRKGWTRGFVRCDWCLCDCETSSDLPQKEIIESNQKIFTEDDLWGTCKKDCDAKGLQKTDAFGCSEIGNCHWHKNGWTRGFVRCDYCECDCIVMAYPDNYRIENVKYKLDLIILSKADTVIVGKTTVENNGDETEKVERSIKTSFTTSRMWTKGKSSTILFGSTVTIKAPILQIGVEITTGLSQEYTYSWGETKTWTIEDNTEQDITSPPHSMREATMTGVSYRADVPYTADLVTIYENGKETRQAINGVLHETSVTDVHLVYGESTPIACTKDSGKVDTLKKDSIITSSARSSMLKDHLMGGSILRDVKRKDPDRALPNGE